MTGQLNRQTTSHRETCRDCNWIAPKSRLWLLFGVLRLIAVLCAVQIMFFFAWATAAQHSDGLFYMNSHGTLIEVSALHSFVLDHLYWLLDRKSVV